MISKKAELPYVDQPLMGSKIHTVLKVLDDLTLSFSEEKLSGNSGCLNICFC